MRILWEGTRNGTLGTSVRNQPRLAPSRTRPPPHPDPLSHVSAFLLSPCPLLPVRSLQSTFLPAIPDIPTSWDAEGQHSWHGEVGGGLAGTRCPCCFCMAANRPLDLLEMGRGLFQSQCWPQSTGDPTPRSWTLLHTEACLLALSPHGQRVSVLFPLDLGS